MQGHVRNETKVSRYDSSLDLGLKLKQVIFETESWDISQSSLCFNIYDSEIEKTWNLESLEN